MDLKAWRKSKGWTQGAVADKIGAIQGTYGAYETGRISIPAPIQAKLRKIGYDGPMPRQEAQDAPAAGVSREDVATELGKLEGRIERLETAYEKLGELVRDLVRESEESRPRGRSA